MKTNNKTWLTPALRLVKRYAPNTYEAMLNADWKVTVVESEKDLFTIAGILHPWTLAELIEGINDGLAVTIAKTEDAPAWVAEPPKALNHTTWMNVRSIYGQAHHAGVDPVCLAASVLVHEWWHRRGYGERKAYDAGTSFALKMGQPRIARLSEKTKAKVGA